MIFRQLTEFPAKKLGAQLAKAFRKRLGSTIRIPQDQSPTLDKLLELRFLLLGELERILSRDVQNRRIVKLIDAHVEVHDLPVQVLLNLPPRPSRDIRHIA